LSYQTALGLLGLDLRHSVHAYPPPMHPRIDMLQAMLSAAQQQQAENSEGTP
jgi:hypothetical protein